MSKQTPKEIAFNAQSQAYKWWAHVFANLKDFDHESIFKAMEWCNTVDADISLLYGGIPEKTPEPIDPEDIWYVEPRWA